MCYCVVLTHAMTGDLDDNDSDSDNADYQFNTPDGLCLARKALQPLLPYDPHDNQLEGICKMINGINLMALTHTDQVFYNVYVTFAGTLKDPRIISPAKKSVPKNQVMVLVFPTNRVEEEMESFTVFSINLLQPFAVPKVRGGNFLFLDTFRKICVAHSIHVRSG